MTSPTQAPPEPKKEAKKGEYVVLVQVESGAPERWEYAGKHRGTAEQAIKQAAADGDKVGGEKFAPGSYVAIPARSFKPVTLKTETTTKVTLS